MPRCAKVHGASGAVMNEDRACEPASHRIGEPSPLAIHLGALWTVADAARASGVAPAPQGARIARDLRAMTRGIEIWQRHPYRRAMPAALVVWSDGSTRLLDYGAAGSRDAAPVLVVPSLINRAHILDLMPDCTMLCALGARGLRPFLLDWGYPGADEAEFGLDDYASLRLLPALAVVQALCGRRAGLMGYCMGGTLAAGVAARRPGSIASLVTLGAPWDFSRETAVAGAIRALALGRGASEAARMLDGLADAFGQIPAALFQTLFALIDPRQTAIKFPRLAAQDPRSAETERFVAIEDWLADAVPMVRRAARDLLVEWQIRNAPASGGWRFLGGKVEPGRITAPSLVVCASGDHIAPPPVAEPLAAAITGARILAPRTGHVGMVVGRAAPETVWAPVAAFLKAHPG